jgi:hypothetical protein
MEMKHREYGNDIVCSAEEDPVRKAPQQSSPGFCFDLGKLEGVFGEPSEHAIKIVLESQSKARLLSFVAESGLENLDLRLGRDVESPHVNADCAGGLIGLRVLRTRDGTSYLRVDGRQGAGPPPPDASLAPVRRQDVAIRDPKAPGRIRVSRPVRVRRSLAAE